MFFSPEEDRLELLPDELLLEEEYDLLRFFLIFLLFLLRLFSKLLPSRTIALRRRTGRG
jgi:hypothetical protein